MSKRLNDTAAVVGMVPYESQSEHYSRSVRKVDNGYITMEHGRNPNDPEGPTHKEVFTRDHPDMKDASMMDGNGGAMKRAVEFMKKRD
jgi:hypothetical protein